MKLATYHDGSRDGQLVVVSRDLKTAHYASGIATRLRQVLDDWNFLSPQLEDLSARLNDGKTRHAFAFDAARCMAPLPRAGAWAMAAADAAAGLRLEYGAADGFCGPCEPIRLPGAAHAGAAAARFEPAVAAITGDVARGVTPAQALEAVRLLLLVNGWRLDAAENAVLACAGSPVAVTPDELGPAWRASGVHLALRVAVNRQPREAAQREKDQEKDQEKDPKKSHEEGCEGGHAKGHGEGGKDGRENSAATASGDGAVPVHAAFGALIAGLARARDVLAGCVVAAPVPGVSENINQNNVLYTGDTVRVEMCDSAGQAVFGVIAQTVELLP